MHRSLSVLALVIALASVSPANAQGRPNFARENRLAVTFGFGVGSVALGREHDLVNAITPYGSTSGFQINAEISFRYYFPWHLLAQVGCGGIYNWATSSILKNHNMTLEVPILVGGYYRMIGRLYLYGALGPSIFFYSRSWFDPGSDLKASGGAGLHVLVGADLMAGENFALGLELRFRYLKAGDVTYKDSVPFMINGKVYPADTPITENMLFGNGSNEGYNLDFTGISLGLNLRFFAL